MKVKIELEKGETIEQADEKLQKALNAKREFHDHERYEDDVLNEVHDYILSQHKAMVQGLLSDIQAEVDKNAR